MVTRSWGSVNPERMGGHRRRNEHKSMERGLVRHLFIAARTIVMPREALEDVTCRGGRWTGGSPADLDSKCVLTSPTMMR